MMNVISNFMTLAWLGTGRCDPNKELMEMIITMSVLAGWAVIIYVLVKLLKSKKSSVMKVVVATLIVLTAAAITFGVYAATVIAYACSGYY